MALALAAQGCTGDDGSGQEGASAPGRGGAGGADHLESVFHDMAEHACGFYERCDLPAVRVYGRGTECVNAYLRVFRAAREDPRVSEALEDAYTQYRPCVDRIAMAPCPGSALHLRGRSGLAGIEAVLEACLVPVSACGPGRTCRGGYVCDAATSNSCGTCIPLPEGQCTDVFDCADSEYCDTNERCVQVKPTGASCQNAIECALGVCSSAGICARPVEAGGACEDARDCDLYLRCVGGICVLPGAEGDDCVPGEVTCRISFACSNGRCTSVENDAGRGAPCALASCGPGLVCDARDAVCSDVIAQGAPCELNSQCGPNMSCGRVDRTCQPLATSGSSCVVDGDCVSDLCALQVCVEPLDCD